MFGFWYGHLKHREKNPHSNWNKGLLFQSEILQCCFATNLILICSKGVWNILFMPQGSSTGLPRLLLIQTQTRPKPDQLQHSCSILWFQTMQQNQGRCKIIAFDQGSLTLISVDWDQYPVVLEIVFVLNQCHRKLYFYDPCGCLC